MKRDLDVGGLAGPALEVVTQSPVACQTQAGSGLVRLDESSSCKRVKLTQVNGYIVYTRARKSRIEPGYDKHPENSDSKRFKCFNEQRNGDKGSVAKEDRMNGTVIEGSIVLSPRIGERAVDENGIGGSLEIDKVVTEKPVLKNVVDNSSGVPLTLNSIELGSMVETVIEESRVVDESEIVGSLVVEQIVMEELPVVEQRYLMNLRVSRSKEDISRQKEWFMSMEGELEEVSALRDDGCGGKHDLPVKARIRYMKSLVKPKVESSGSLDSDAQVAGNELVSNFHGAVVADGSELDTPRKLELKMSKKISLNRCPMTVKELFETGLLDGTPVVYMGTISSKTAGLRGIIKDGGILCSCSYCKGCRVIPPSQFEIHACKQYKRAAQYICFENGKSLLEVLRACRRRPLHTLEATIRSILTALPEEKSFTCRRCKGSFPIMDVGQIGPLCSLCVKSKKSQGSPTSATSSQPRSRELVLVSQSSESMSAGTSSQNRSPWKITRKSSELDMEPKTPKFASLCISSQTKSASKITRRATKPGLAAKSSKSAPVQSLQNKGPWKIAKKSVNPILIPKSYKSASAHLYSQNRSQWKMTTKDQRLHKLVFERGGLPDGTEVAYYARGQRLLEGYKMGFGIFCRCCNSEVSPSQFEAHAGWASRRKPYAYIYTSNGVSLHELALSLSKGRRFSAKDNDNVCIICADGGSLLLCDGCPRAFHKECACLPTVPRGRWYCKYCENLFVREKFVEHNANAVAAGRVLGVDAIDQITRRCIRIVKNVEAELSGCVLCRCSDFSKSGFGPRTILLCDQCEKEYHVGCLRTHKMADLRELPRGKWFCCPDCSRIYSTLQKLLVRGPERLPDFLLDVVKKKYEEKGSDSTVDIDVRWRLLSSKLASNETRLLLSEAVAIFHECFDPIVDSVTGRDLIPCMVYGRNIRGQEFGGMYCAVLTVNSIVVSAGILRVFGQEFAEVPLVATRLADHGKGYFQLLFSCVEKLLAFLNVHSIVLPAAEHAESIWTDKFGFNKLKPDQLSRYRKGCCPMVTFKGTSMLQKEVPPCRVVNRNTEPTESSSELSK